MIPGGVGPIVGAPQPSLGNALAAAGRPVRPPRPMLHWKTGKPPTMEYRKNHPTFQAPASPPALPVKASRGPSTNDVKAYVRALSGVRK